MLKIHGANPSPFVRKVRVALSEKNIPYELDPVAPVKCHCRLQEDEPAGQDPGIRGRGADLAGFVRRSSAYLEREHPTPPIYPSDP